MDNSCSDSNDCVNPQRETIVANENTARLALCAFNDAQFAYREDTGCFTSDIATLTDAATPYLAADWRGPIGLYNITWFVDDNYFVASAGELDLTGSLAFYTDASGTIRVEEGLQIVS